MGAFEDALARLNEISTKEESVPLTLKGAPVKNQYYSDPDTVVLNGQSYRLGGGFNAPEVAHIKGGIFVPAERLNDDTAQQETLVQKQLGLTDVVPTGEKDKYGRKIADIVNPNQPDVGTLSESMIKYGAAPVTDRTPLKSLNNMVSLRAAAGLFANETNDPLVQMAVKNFAKPVQAEPKMLLSNEADYASAKSMVGVGAAAKAAEEVDRLTGILKDPSLRPDLRESLTKQLDGAKQTVWIASTTPDFAGGVLNRHDDRNLMNMANDPMKTAFIGALRDVASGVGGILQMAGEGAGWDWLSKRAAAGIRQNKAEQGLMPNYLSDFHDIRTDTTWHTIADTTQYLGNQFAGSLPIMAGLMASTAATGGMGPAAAFITSSAPGSMIYAGQYYANQPDDKKNAGLAISLGVASGVLDKLGLEAVMLKSNPLSVVGRKEIISAISSAKSISEAEAMKLFTEYTKKELTQFAKSGAEFAKQQFMTNEAFARGLASLVVAGGTEAATETLQQYAQMVAEKGMWNNDAIYDRDFANQMLNAAIGGGAMGTVMHGAGQIKDTAQWHSIADSYKQHTEGLNEAQLFQAENIRQGSPYKDPMSVARVIADEPLEGGITKTKLMDMDSSKGTWNGIKAIITDPMRLVRQLGDTIAPSIVDDNGNFRTNMALLKSIIGGYGILPGDHMIGFKQRLMGYWGGNKQDEIATQLKTDRNTVNKLMQDAYNNYWSKDQRLPDTPTNTVLQSWKDNQDRILDNMRQNAAQYGVSINELHNKNALFEAAAIDPSAVRRQKQDILDILESKGMSRFLANKTFEALLSGNKDAAQKARDVLSDKGVFSDPRVSNLFESNMFNSIENLKDRVSTEIAHKSFLGEDGSVLAKLLQKAWANGEFGNNKEAYLDAVKNTQDWYEIVKGSYHSLDKYPLLKKVLGWGTTLTMLASLSKAALSSQTETAMSTLGTPAELVQKQLATYASEFFKEYRSDLNKMSSSSMAWIGISALKARKVPNHEKEYTRIEGIEHELAGNPSVERVRELEEEINKLHEKVFARTLFDRLGYNETGFNTQSKFEYSDNNPRDAMQLFASLIALKAQTDSTRMAVLSVAGDIVLNKITSLRMIPREHLGEAILSGRHMTREQAQSLQELQAYGMDVMQMIEFLDQYNPEDIQTVLKDAMNPDSRTASAAVQANLMTVLGNLVDSRVVNPQAHNMPKYFNDPRLRIVTAMGRFMAAAHATVLPRLYKTYMLEGNVGMRYQAFSTMAMALLFAAVANALKDELSYGDESPYIKGTRKNIQRTVNASGLIGQYEKVLDTIAPLYPSSGPDFSKNPAGWAANKVVGMSPQLSWAHKLGSGVVDTLNGNTAQGVKQLVRTAPVVGSFPIAASKAAELFK